MFVSLALHALTYRTMASRKKSSSQRRTRASGSRLAESSNRDSGTLVGSSSQSARSTRQRAQIASLAASVPSLPVPPSTTAGRHRDSSPPYESDDSSADPTYHSLRRSPAVNQVDCQTPTRPQLAGIQSSPEGNVDRTKKMTTDAKRIHQEHFGPELYKKCAICLDRPLRQIEHCHIIERGVERGVSGFYVENILIFHSGKALKIA
jgi:hypothetical protein